MRILELLNDRSDKKLISYGKATLTKIDFAAYVNSLYEKITKVPELKTESFILLREEGPIRFYGLIFALWKNNNKVVFPNRDCLVSKDIFSFCEYVVTLKGDDVVVEQNRNYNAVSTPGKGDTVLFSSGSTGAPKGILHAKDHLLHNAASVNKRIGYTGYASITLLKPYLVSAFNHFLIHFLSDSHLIFLDYEDVSQISKFYKADPALALVGSPIHILSSMHFIDPESRPLFFFSSGDFMYPNNIRKILEKFPDAVFFNVYGLAEIAGRFFMNKIKKGTDYSLYSSIGENIKGTEYEIRGSQIYVSSQFHFFGYITKGTFLPSSIKHPSGDILRQEGGVTSLNGRIDDEVKIGGNKISLKNIEKKISDIFKDEICVVFDTTHPRLGTLFALAMHTENRYNRTELLKRLRGSLKPFEIPHMFYYMKKIPYTQAMKIDRNALKHNTEKLTPII